MISLLAAKVLPKALAKAAPKIFSTAAKAGPKVALVGAGVAVAGLGVKKAAEGVENITSVEVGGKKVKLTGLIVLAVLVIIAFILWRKIAR